MYEISNPDKSVHSNDDKSVNVIDEGESTCNHPIIPTILIKVSSPKGAAENETRVAHPLLPRGALVPCQVYPGGLMRNAIQSLEPEAKRYVTVGGLLTSA